MKIVEKSSYERHTVDALASGVEEGRDKLRKAVGSRKEASIHGYPNGATQCESCRTTRKGDKPGELKHLSSRRKSKQ